MRVWALLGTTTHHEKRALKIAFNLPNSTESAAACALMGVLSPRHRTALELAKRNIRRGKFKPAARKNSWGYDDTTAAREAHVDISVRDGVVTSNKVTLACRAPKQAEVLLSPHYDDDFPEKNETPPAHYFLNPPKIPPPNTDKKAWWTTILRNIPSGATTVMTDGSYDNSPVAGAGVVIFWPSGRTTTHRAPASFERATHTRANWEQLRWRQTS